MIGGTLFEIKQRDVLLVEFPFSDLSDTKPRPILVLSDNIFNSSSSDLIGCLITSNVNTDLKNVLIFQSDFESGYLNFDSIIKPYKLFTFDKSLIIKKLGTLNIKKYLEVYTKLLELVSPK